MAHSTLGFSMETVFHREAGQAVLLAIDAREAVEKHPEEWSRDPWPDQTFERPPEPAPPARPTARPR